MLIGDLDEIVDGSKFIDFLAQPLFLSKTSKRDFNSNQPWCLSMSLHYYNWMCRAVGAAEVWQRSVLYRVEYLLHPLTAQALVAQASGQDAPLEDSSSWAHDSLPSSVRERDDKTSLVGERDDTLPSGCLPGFQYTETLVGWHASYFFNRSGIENKLRSFWHANEAAQLRLNPSTCLSATRSSVTTRMPPTVSQYSNTQPHLSLTPQHLPRSGGCSLQGEFVADQEKQEGQSLNPFARIQVRRSKRSSPPIGSPPPAFLDACLSANKQVH